MSDPKEQQEQQTPDPQQPDLAEELNKLGGQLEKAIRSILSVDPARIVQRDLSASVNELSKQFQSAFQSINENPDIKNLTTQGHHVISQVQELPILNDFRKTLATGVAQLNEQLDQFTTKVQSSQSTQESTNKMQSIPIEEDE